jgi:hypothetical protein
VCLMLGGVRKIDVGPGAPAFEFAGARSFVVFEGAGFRFREAPDLPAKENEERREDNSYRKILM